jgi:branched-chain amino acid transport system substrate-binding protein
MMRWKHGLFGIGMALISATGSAPTRAQAPAPRPILIGEINSYTGPSAAFTHSYRLAFDMAVDEVNKAGGVLGRPLQVIYRDDSFSPAEGVRQARELLENQRVDVLAGTFFSPIALAVSAVANQEKRFFLAAEPLSDRVTWQQGSRYVFRIRNPTWQLVAMLARQAAALSCTRWGVLSSPDDASRDNVENFRKQLAALKPGARFVGAHIVPVGQMNAGAAIDALEAMNAECVFNTIFGSDLFSVVREGNMRGFFQDVQVVSVLSGEPEYLDPLGTETPRGWIVTGYPWQDDNSSKHKVFREAFMARYNDYPRLGALVGYITAKALAAGIAKAGDTETEALIRAFRGLQFDSPVGPITIRAGDHQATFGSWVGRLDIRNGRGVMADWQYLNGADYLPPEGEARAWRPAAAND